MAQAPELKRSLSLTLLVLYGLGVTVGGGIYILIGKVAGRAGLYAPVSFLVAAGLATFTALSYAELSARFPKSAGEAVYVEEGLGRPSLAIITGFLLVGVGVLSSSALSTGFIGYLHTMVRLPEWLAVTALVGGLGLLAAWGIRQSASFAALVTVIEIGGLLLVLWAGRDLLADLPSRMDELLPPLEAGAWLGVVGGSVLAFYAFIGFEDMVNVAEEVKDVTRTMPRAIILTLALTVVLYLGVATVAVLALAPAELAASGAPLSLVYERRTGQPATAINLIGVLTVVNGILIQIILASRVLYGMSQRRWLPAVLGRVNARTRTPLVSTALVVGAVLGLGLAFPMEELAQATTLATLVVFTLINASLVGLKRRGPTPQGAPSMPVWVPATGFVVSLAFAVLEAADLVGWMA